MTDIYIARHGEDKDNANGVLNGRRDRPLTVKGREQARDLGRYVAGEGLSFDAVYASPLKRAYETAEIVSEYADLPEPEVLDALVERDFGEVTGAPIDSLRDWPEDDVLETDGVRYALTPAGAETFPELKERATRALEHVPQQDASDVLFVAHGDIGKMMYAAYYDLGWDDALRDINFGNSQLLYLSHDSPVDDTHMFEA